MQEEGGTLCGLETLYAYQDFICISLYMHITLYAYQDFICISPPCCPSDSHARGREREDFNPPARSHALYTPEEFLPVQIHDVGPEDKEE